MRRLRFIPTAVPLLALLVFSTAAAAPPMPTLDPPPKPWPQVMVVGTVHFDNPGLDAVMSALDDVLSPKRQREIAALVDALARFRPTKIAVEREPRRAEALNARYRAWCAGTDTLTRNEIDQLGFRLAQRFGHDRLHAIDHDLPLDIGAALSWAAQNGQPDQVAAFGAFVKRLEAWSSQVYATETITGIVAAQNDDARADDGVALYQLMSRIGRDSVYVGADVAADWYERNLRMYANLLRIVEPNDRVLVLVGGGHRPLLRQMLRQTPGVEFVPTMKYLK
jgi:hypothetical protein